MKNVSSLNLQIGYKVVRLHGQKLVSGIIDDKKFTTEYGIGVMTKPIAAGTRLMAFATIEAATRFYEDESNADKSTKFFIYEAILVNARKLPQVFQVREGGFYSKPSEVIRNWKRLFDETPIYDTCYYRAKIAPNNSLGCERIQLTKLVK